MEHGTVLRIEKISPNDGHGLRTVIFLKGCPLRCAWCSTPESQSAAPEWFYKQAKCLHCARCIQACPQGALSVSADRTAVVRDKRKCVNCFQCASVCCSHAIGVYGKTMTVEQVMKEIRKESLFYFCSGGGVTLSGGDVLLQADFARAILMECREDCINTMAELDMYGPYENIQKVLAHLDSCFIDVKLMNPQQHKQWTGADNVSILDNIRRTALDFPHTPLHIRVPLIPGVNDTAENIRATAAFCETLATCHSLEFLPYHRLGTAAYQYTDRPYALGQLPPMTYPEAYEHVRVLKDRPLPFSVQIAGKTI
jgi:pyruvate formate lyase activating enzyme